MSSALVDIAMKAKTGSATTKLLLIVLCGLADDSGGCSISSPAIAEECELSERAVREHLAKLEKSGALTRVMSPGKSTTYIIRPGVLDTPAPRADTPAPRADTPAPRAEVDSDAKRKHPPTPPLKENILLYNTNTPPIVPPTEKPEAPPQKTTTPKSRREKFCDVDKPDGVTEETWEGWLKLRRAKRAPLSEAAWALLKREVAKAGVSLQEALEVCVERSWQGFKAEWLKNTGPPRRQSAHPIDEQLHEHSNYPAVSRL